MKRPATEGRTRWPSLVAAAVLLLTAPTVLASRPAPATPETHHSRTAPPPPAASTATLATLTAASPFHPITALDIRISTVRLGRERARGVLPIPALPELGWPGVKPRPAKERSLRQTTSGDDLLATLDMRGGRLLDHTFTPDPGTHRLVDGAGLGFTYDPFGNRAAARPLPAGTSTETLHDWDNRLLAARTEGVATPHTTFRYDPLGRRIAETVAGRTTVRLHWGERVLEEDLLAQDGTPTPRKRLYWGNAIDELAAYDWDGDLDGQLETRLYPLQDEQGTIHAVADADGVLAESYLVRPDGSVQIHGSDRTRPRLVLARLLPITQGTQRLQLVYSEPTQHTDATTVTIADGQSQPQPLTFTTEQGRVWLAELTPTLMQGGTFTLQLEGVEDLSGNQIDPQTVPFTAPDPVAGIVLPTAAEADVLAVLDGPQQLAIVLGTAVDPASLPTGLVTVRRSGLTVAGSVTIHTGSSQPLEGAVLMWTPTDPAQYQLGPCEVTLGTGLQDLAGHPIHAPPDPIAYDRRGEGDIIWSQLEDAPILSASQVGNDRFLHGRPLIASLGLYDHRARWYDPTTQTFLEPDPLGPVDSPNLYQAFGLDPQNNTDPLGESWWTAAQGYVAGVVDEADMLGLLPAVEAADAGARAGSSDADDFDVAKQTGRWTLRALTIVKAGAQKVAQFGLKQGAKVLVKTQAKEYLQGMVASAAGRLSGEAVEKLAREMGVDEQTATWLGIAARDLTARGASAAARGSSRRSLAQSTSPPTVTRKIPRDKLRFRPKERGRAPVGDDGKPVELHHEDQDLGNASGRVELTRFEHRGPGNFSNKHSNTGQRPSAVERDESKRQHRAHWEREWDAGEFDNLPPQKE